MRTILGAALLTLGAAGCGAKPTPIAKDTLSTRARQEAVGNSGIPGAKGINRALEASDSATARNQRLDSIGQP